MSEPPLAGPRPNHSRQHALTIRDRPPSRPLPSRYPDRCSNPTAVDRAFCNSRVSHVPASASLDRSLACCKHEATAQLFVSNGATDARAQDASPRNHRAPHSPQSALPTNNLHPSTNNHPQQQPHGRESAHVRPPGPPTGWFNVTVSPTPARSTTMPIAFPTHADPFLHLTSGNGYYVVCNKDCWKTAWKGGECCWDGGSATCMKV
jgi:hypothetical protein